MLFYKYSTMVSPSRDQEEVCVICKRPLANTKRVSKHHLIPKSRGGKHTDTVLLHNICHQKIHSVFSEKELQREYHTVEKLTEHEEMRKFIKWVKKKDINFYQKNRKMGSK